MAQTYAQFKTFVQEAIWRPNDTTLANNLDKIIRMADSELNRKLDIQRREVAVDIAPETEDYSLPSDFYQMLSLTNTSNTNSFRERTMRNTTFAHIEEQRAQTNSAVVQPYYHVKRAASANTLYLIGPFSAATPGSFALNYRTTVPDFETDDSSWLEADYLDLYLYTVLKHVGMWLREDERVQFYSALMADCLSSALEEDKMRVRFGGSPLEMRPNRIVPQTRRR